MEKRLKSKSLVAMTVVGVALLALAATAIAGPGRNGERPDKGKPTTTTTASTTTSTTVVPPDSSVHEADMRFVSMMIPHHHQALVMSRLAPDRTVNAELLALAGRIDVEQAVEIATMQRWQTFHGLEETDPANAYATMMEDPAMIEMMGMATSDQLEQLEALSGDAFDRLFLQLMIDHHDGAVRMCVDVMTNGQDPVIQSMANEMLTTQSTQIAQMEAMLAQLQ